MPGSNWGCIVTVTRTIRLLYGHSIFQACNEITFLGFEFALVTNAFGIRNQNIPRYIPTERELGTLGRAAFLQLLCSLSRKRSKEAAN